MNQNEPHKNKHFQNLDGSYPEWVIDERGTKILIDTALLPPDHTWKVKPRTWIVYDNDPNSRDFGAYYHYRIKKHAKAALHSSSVSGGKRTP